eukprot:1142243-Pelagomonas_calceolata.AAC.3
MTKESTQASPPKRAACHGICWESRQACDPLGAKQKYGSSVQAATLSIASGHPFLLSPTEENGAAREEAAQCAQADKAVRPPPERPLRPPEAQLAPTKRSVFVFQLLPQDG